LAPGIGPFESETIPETDVWAFTPTENINNRSKKPRCLKCFDLLLINKKLVIKKLIKLVN
jgi:hypothetical protein